MTVVLLIVLATALFALVQAVSRAGLARGHRQVGDFVGWTVVGVAALAIAVVAAASLVT